MTGKTKIWISMSILWVFLWAVLAIELADSRAGLTYSRLLLIVVGPLIAGWGIRWIRRE